MSLTNDDPVWDHAEPFIYEVQVVPADIDGFQHVNNSVYLRWLNDCAWAHSSAVGLSEDACVALRRGMAVRSVSLELLAAAYLHDDLGVANWLTKVTRLRATRVYQIVNAASKETLLRGHIDYVCINLDNGQPVRMPPEFQAGYAATLI